MACSAAVPHDDIGVGALLEKDAERMEVAPADARDGHGAVGVLALDAVVGQEAAHRRLRGQAGHLAQVARTTAKFLDQENHVSVHCRGETESRCLPSSGTDRLAITILVLYFTYRSSTYMYRM